MSLYKKQKKFPIQLKYLVAGLIILVVILLMIITIALIFKQKTAPNFLLEVGAKP